MISHTFRRKKYKIKQLIRNLYSSQLTKTRYLFVNYTSKFETGIVGSM